MYDPFRDPETQQSLNETMPEPERQKYGFDARALFDLLRRRGRARLAQGDLNFNAFDSGGSTYKTDEGGMLHNFDHPEIGADPLDQNQVDDLYQLEDASPFKQAGFVSSGAQPYGGGDSDADRLGYRADQPSSMAFHAARKQRPF